MNEALKQLQLEGDKKTVEEDDVIDYLSHAIIKVKLLLKFWFEIFKNFF